MENSNNLPVLLENAGNRLLEAKTSGEILEARRIAQAVLHYARVTDAANETHADCLRIIARAEIRMADAIDAGQESGEVATQERGRPQRSVRTSDTSLPATLDDLGVSRQRLSEWREMRDAGEEAVEEAIQAALSEDRPPTSSDIRTHIRGTFGTGDNEWYTPKKYIDKAKEVLDEIDLDPASSELAQEVIEAKNYFDEEVDGLEQEWSGRVWLNPPYTQPNMSNFVHKLCEEYESGKVTEAILLTHNYSDTSWYQEAGMYATGICEVAGRIKFYNQSGDIAAPTQGQHFFYFGGNWDKFKNVFSEIGLIARFERD